MRYLTQNEKRAILVNWNRVKNRQMKLSVVDKDIIPLCDALNELRGVCTIQSCSGHPNSPNPDGSHYVQKAHLWIRLDRRTARAFYKYALELAENKSIEVVEILLNPKNQGEVVSIIFEGNNSGLLSAASNTILSFFSKLN